MISKIEAGGNYTRESDCVSVEVLEFSTIILKDDCYTDKIEAVVYIDEESNVRVMEINEFSQNHC